MTKIQVKQESGDGSEVITDSKGRKLTLKEPDFILESRITRVCGEASTNVGYMYAYVFPAIWVTAIDDSRIPFPTTFLELEGLMARVGREGTEAVLLHRSKTAESSEHEAAVKN